MTNTLWITKHYNGRRGILLAQVNDDTTDDPIAGTEREFSSGVSSDAEIIANCSAIIDYAREMAALHGFSRVETDYDADLLLGRRPATGLVSPNAQIRALVP